MPEIGLTLTLPELQAQVCWFLFGTDDQARVSPIERNMLGRCIFNGLRRFYYPAQVQADLNHDWSFLQSEFTLITEVGTQDYLQPFDFGGVVGPLHHIPTDQIRVPVTKTTVEKILRMREFNVSVSLWPMWFAERAVHSGGRQSTRYQILVWPSPSAVFTFKGTQRILPLAPNATQEFLYGGPEHSQTIIEACLAQAELMLENQPGAHTAEFLNCLKTSIVLDGQMHAPEFLGYNGDGGSDGTALMRDGRHFENFSPVTVSGSR